MNPHSIFSRFCHSPIPRCAAILLVALAWSNLAFSGEIHDAAGSGDSETVKALLKDNPDLVFSRNTNDWTALHYAAWFGHKDVAELLLAGKAKVDAKANNGVTPLHWAAEKGHKDVVELLLASGAAVDARSLNGSTPLHWAALNGYEEVAHGRIVMLPTAPTSPPAQKPRTPALEYPVSAQWASGGLSSCQGEIPPGCWIPD